MTETLTKQAFVTHVELPLLAKKQEEVKHFYQTVFGWTISFDMMPGYGMTTNLEPSIGMPIQDEVEARKLGVYFEVDDINVILDQVSDLGGEVVSEKNLISDSIGFGASFKDPSGNIVGLFAKS